MAAVMSKTLHRTRIRCMVLTYSYFNRNISLQVWPIDIFTREQQETYRAKLPQAD